MNFVVLIDWSQGGHNATYLQAFGVALGCLGSSVEYLVAPPLAVVLRDAETTGGGVDPEHVTAVEWPGFLPIRPRSWQISLRRRFFAGKIANALQGIRGRHPGASCTLFFTCLFEQDFDLAHRVAELTGLPWTFLYLHPYLFADPPSDRFVQRQVAEQVLRHPRLAGIATINEHLIEGIARFSAKPVIRFPEITDERLEPDHPLGLRYRQFARERALVATAGYLGAWKGVGFLARACLAMDPANFAFLFAGVMPLDTFGPEERGMVERCLAEAPHAIFHLARVPDGPPYNAILAASDVIFAAFENFPFSSNTLTKAALLRKPVIVSEGSLAATRVREFRLGVVVPYGDGPALIGAIESFSTPEQRETFARQARRDEYLALHGAARLEAAFRDLFDAPGGRAGMSASG